MKNLKLFNVLILVTITIFFIGCTDSKTNTSDPGTANIYVKHMDEPGD